MNRVRKDGNLNRSPCSSVPRVDTGVCPCVYRGKRWAGGDLTCPTTAINSSVEIVRLPLAVLNLPDITLQGESEHSSTWDFFTCMRRWNTCFVQSCFRSTCSRVMPLISNFRGLRISQGLEPRISRYMSIAAGLPPPRPIPEMRNGRVVQYRG